MPIATPISFKCEKCGYFTIRMVGDVITINDIHPKCPKCGAKMKTSTPSIWDRIRYTISNLI